MSAAALGGAERARGHREVAGEGTRRQRQVEGENLGMDAAAPCGRKRPPEVFGRGGQHRCQVK